nr:uncharacterized protein PF3D7_1120000-like [Anolis sagrei ordinatus]
MMIPKVKMDKDRDKEKEKKMQNRKDSLTKDPSAEETILKKEELTMKDLMREILKLQTDVNRIEGKQDKQYNSIKKEMEEMKREVKEEVQMAMKEEVKNIYKEIETLRQERKEDAKESKAIKHHQRELEKTVHIVEKKIEVLQTQQEILEAKEKEYQLRFRNIQEEDKENIREIIANMVAQLLQLSREESEDNIDRTFRIQSNYAKRYNVPRDVVVCFGKKSVRDKVLKENAKRPTYYKGNKVAILKEHPKAVLERRCKYFFLTDELKKRNIRFKWEKREGIMVTWEDNKHWLTTKLKARAFFDKYMGKEGEDPKECEGKDGRGEEDDQENNQARQRKRPREVSPKEHKSYADSALANTATDREKDETDGKKY